MDKSSINVCWNGNSLSTHGCNFGILTSISWEMGPISCLTGMIGRIFTGWINMPDTFLVDPLPVPRVCLAKSSPSEHSQHLLHFELHCADCRATAPCTVPADLSVLKGWKSCIPPKMTILIGKMIRNHQKNWVSHFEYEAFVCRCSLKTPVNQYNVVNPLINPPKNHCKWVVTHNHHS